jgi:CO/xanthine dehydrogenase Mo-binding subunit
MGQGADTVIAQIVAEELGLQVGDIHVIHSDTNICPWDVGSHASRTTFVAGNAALGAAKKIKARLGGSRWGQATGSSPGKTRLAGSMHFSLG